jgi:hypothetical protein
LLVIFIFRDHGWAWRTVEIYLQFLKYERRGGNKADDGGDEDEDMGISEKVSQFKLTEGTADAIMSRVTRSIRCSIAAFILPRTPGQPQQSSRMAKRKAQASSESESEAQLSTDTEPKSRPPAKKKATAVS